MLKFDLDDDELVTMTNEIGFSGYNPVVTFNIVMKVINRDETRMKSLITLIVFGLTRGFGAGKTSKDILDRTNVAGRDSLNAAFQLFRVKFQKPKDRKDITISRILTAFPVLVYKLHEKLLVNGAAHDDKFNGDLPIQFRYPGSPSMMTKQTWETQIENYLIFIEYMSNLWRKEYDDDEARKYAELSFNSELSPMNVRR